MQVGIEYAKKYDADLLIATDPDCDRVGIAVKDKDDFKLLTGNQTGILLFDYICSMRLKHNNMPNNPIAIKTIVTSDMVDKVAENYGVRVINVLTGFKFIGEQIGYLEEKGLEKTYIFGLEESYGYLSSGHVRDKDAVNGAFLIAEMFSYYKTKGISLLEKLHELYEKYGYFSNYLKSFEFDGVAGFHKMNEIMEHFRNSFKGIGSYKVVTIEDFEKGLYGLPKSNVLKMYLTDGVTLVIRPSGTEPKLKVYMSMCGKSEEENNCRYEKLMKDIEEVLK